MKKIYEILKIKTDEFKKKSFDELKNLSNEVVCFDYKHDGVDYQFEVHFIYERDLVKVMVECSRKGLIVNMFGVQSCFSKRNNNEVIDINPADF